MEASSFLIARITEVLLTAVASHTHTMWGVVARSIYTYTYVEVKSPDALGSHAQCYTHDLL